MVTDWFITHKGLVDAGRLPSLAQVRRRISVAELLILFASGAAAAVAVGKAKLGLGIPGHSIVLAALPMVLGMALAPRRFAGSVISTGALGTAWALAGLGVADFGAGSFVSLCLLGPMMDAALHKAQTGRRVYAALILAGVLTNVLALASRAGAKVIGLDVGSRPFDSWWLQASMTYTLSGAVAGLLGALCWFHFNSAGPQRGSRPTRA
jgi:hypothetical protein